MCPGLLPSLQSSVFGRRGFGPSLLPCKHWKLASSFLMPENSGVFRVTTKQPEHLSDQVLPHLLRTLCLRSCLSSLPKNCLPNLGHKLSHAVLFGLYGLVPCVHAYVCVFVLMGGRGQAHV